MELAERVDIAIIFAWGYITKLLLMGYQVDKADPDKALTVNRWLWYNSQKWRVIGSFWFLIGLAFISPTEGFQKLSEFVVWDGVPIGHLGVAAVGFLGDEIFCSLDSMGQYVKDRFNKRKTDGQQQQRQTD